jgi:hypothetical protein
MYITYICVCVCVCVYIYNQLLYSNILHILSMEIHWLLNFKNIYLDRCPGWPGTFVCVYV